MTQIRRVLKVLAAALAFGAYVWYAAVRNVPAVRRRKVARRRARGGTTD